MTESVSSTNYSISDSLLKTKNQAAQEAKAKQDQALAEKSLFDQSFAGKTQNFTGIDTQKFTSNFNLFESGKSWGTEFSELGSGVGQVATSPLQMGGNIIGGTLGIVGSILNPFLKLGANILGSVGTAGQQATASMKSTTASTTQQKAGTTATTQNGAAGKTQASTPATSSPTTTPATTSTTSNSGVKASSSAPSNINMTWGQVKANSAGTPTLNTHGLEETSSSVRAAVEEYNEATGDVEQFTKDLNEAAKNKDAASKIEDQAYVEQQKQEGLAAYFGEKAAATQKDLDAQNAILSKIDQNKEPDRYKQVKASVDRLQAQLDKLNEQKNNAELAAAQAGQKAGSTHSKTDEAVAKFQTAQAKLAAAQKLQAQTKSDVDSAVNGELDNKNGDAAVDGYVAKLGGQKGVDSAKEQVKADSALADKVESAADNKNEISDAAIATMAQQAVNSGDIKMPDSLKGKEAQWEQAVNVAKVKAGKANFIDGKVVDKKETAGTTTTTETPELKDGMPADVASLTETGDIPRKPTQPVVAKVSQEEPVESEDLEEKPLTMDSSDSDYEYGYDPEYDMAASQVPEKKEVNGDATVTVADVNGTQVKLPEI